MFHEKELSQLLELNAYKIPLGALGGGRGAVATRHFGAGIAHYARRMRLPGAMLAANWLHGRDNRWCLLIWITHTRLSIVVMSYVSRVGRGMTETRASLPPSASDALADPPCCRARSSCASRRSACSCARHSAPTSSAWLPVHAARCTPVSRVHATALPACSSRAVKRVLAAQSSPTTQKSSCGAAHLDLDDGGS